MRVHLHLTMYIQAYAVVLKVCVCLHVNMSAVCNKQDAGSPGARKMAVLSYPTWIWRAKARSHGKGESVSNGWEISPASTMYFSLYELGQKSSKSRTSGGSIPWDSWRVAVAEMPGDGSRGGETAAVACRKGYQMEETFHLNVMSILSVSFREDIF